jgi:hypothetical protein
MEYKELEMLWKQYDEKLNNLEKINKKLQKDILYQTREQLNWLEFGSLYGLIGIPIILFIAFWEFSKIENLDWKFILGCILTFIAILYVCVTNLQAHSLVKKINLGSDSIIRSLDKVIKLKKIANNHLQYVFLYYPLAFLGIVLIAWNNFTFNTNTMIFLAVLFVLAYFRNIVRVKSYKGRISKLEKDIIELKEYTEE